MRTKSSCKIISMVLGHQQIIIVTTVSKWTKHRTMVNSGAKINKYFEYINMSSLDHKKPHRMASMALYASFVLAKVSLKELEWVGKKWHPWTSSKTKTTVDQRSPMVKRKATVTFPKNHWHDFWEIFSGLMRLNWNIPDGLYQIPNSISK